MRIALDAMGGDYAPKEIVKGAVAAVADHSIEILLVGDQKAIEAELKGYDTKGAIQIVHAPEVIEMDEHPAAAVRRKKNASIVVATALVKEGKADAVVSAGNTGAAMAAALFGLGRINGIERPAIAVVIPTLKGEMIIVDVGANADCKPKHLQQFAVMGSIYANRVLGVYKPLSGLINIGAEETKGNELTQAVHQILKETPGVNFYGNIEGRDLLPGIVDIAVCDGFVGNVVLKTLEGAAMTLMGMMKESLKPLAAKVGPENMNQLLDDFKRKIDYSEYGGAPLLGVNGVSIISHGSSHASAIKNAIGIAIESVEHSLVSAIEASISELQEGEVS